MVTWRTMSIVLLTLFIMSGITAYPVVRHYGPALLSPAVYARIFFARPVPLAGNTPEITSTAKSLTPAFPVVQLPADPENPFMKDPAAPDENTPGIVLTLLTGRT